MPKISLIMPVFNVGKYVLGAMQSVQNQDFKDFECICVNDGSADDSGTIMDDFCKTDKRFIPFHQENKGLSATRNFALAKAKGDYIFFIDSDDYIHPQTLSFLYTMAHKNPDADIITSGYVKTPKIYGETVFEKLDPQKIKADRSTDPLMSYIRGKKIKTQVWGELYKKELFKTLGFIEGIYFEDVPFTTMVMEKAKKIVITDAPLYYYFQTDSSIMRSNFTVKKAASYFLLIEEITGYIHMNRPAAFPVVQKEVLNARVKMVLNQAIKKQRDKAKRQELFDYIRGEVIRLYNQGIISYQGLKIYHKVALFLLLHSRTGTPARIWMQLIK
ncbi:MAG: glycosyltransferase [Lactobacillales bacterium]|jgi:glycosyltransferase involved in cell wall biosynthesis|nr:glycosyltransferase [Lactobacillales bacterium]